MHRAGGVHADERGCGARGSRFVQVELGNQWFTNGHCLSFLHFLIHVSVAVVKAGSEGELALETKAKLWSYHIKIVKNSFKGLAL